MQVTIDLSQSPKMLEDELTRVIRLALGNNYYIDNNLEDSAAVVSNAPVNTKPADLPPLNAGATQQPNFSPNELSNPTINLPGGAPQGANAGSTPAGADLDIEGNPWDSRIHSGGKSKIANGTWKLKKGADPVHVQQVLAQNKALIASPLPGAAPNNVVPLNQLPTTAGLPDLPPLNPEPVKQLPEAEVVVTDYPSFAEWIAQQAAKPHLKDVVTQNLDHGLKHYGFVDAAGNPHLAAVAHRPDAIDGFYRWMRFQVLGQQ